MAVFSFVLAACLAAACEVLLTRANPGVRLPFWLGRPPCYPTAARVLRGLAAGSAVIGAITLDNHFEPWSGVILIVVTLLPAAVYRMVQNGRVRTPDGR